MKIFLQNRKQNMVFDLFLRLLPVQLLLTAITSLSAFFDSFLVSVALGENALAAMNLLRGFTGFVMIFGILLTDGLVFLMGNAICRGLREESNRIFSITLVLSVFIGFFITALCLLFAEPIGRLLGADESVLPLCCNLLRGYAGYYLLLPVSSVFATLFEIRSDSRASVLSLSLTLFAHVGLTCLFLFPLQKDLTYVGIAASAAQTACVAFFLIRNAVKKLGVYSRPKNPFPVIGKLLAMGFASSGGLVFSCFKDILVCRNRADFGGIKALSASGVVAGLDAVTYTFLGPAFLTVTLMICGIFVHERDRDSLRRFAKIAFALGCGIALFTLGIMFFLAEPTSKLYQVEDVSYTTYALRVYSFAYLPYLPNMLFIKIFATLKRTKLANIITVVSGLAVPVAVTYLLTGIFGEAAVWPLMPISEVVSLLSTLVIISIANRGIPKSFDELMGMQSDFGVSRGDTYSVQLQTREDAVTASEGIVEFCRRKGLNERTAFLCGLCMEEVSTNIITHGFRHKKRNGIVEVTVIYGKGAVKLLVRDNCPPFDPYQKLATFDSEDPTRGVGIRLMMKSADQMEYKNMYGLNLLTVVLQERNE